MKHKIKADWKEGLHFEVETETGALSVDGPQEVGGQGKGMRAKPLMLSSLAGCTGMDVASLMKKMHVEVDDFYIEVSAELTDEHPKTYKYVKVDYFFKGNNLNTDKLTKAVSLSFEKYCGVIAMFKTFAIVEFEMHFN